MQRPQDETRIAIIGAGPGGIRTGQAEILAYMEELAERYGLRSHCRFGTGVRAARFDPAHHDVSPL